MKLFSYVFYCGKICLSQLFSGIVFKDWLMGREVVCMPLNECFDGFFYWGSDLTLDVGFMLIYNLELIKSSFCTEYQFKVLLDRVQSFMLSAQKPEEHTGGGENVASIY